MATQSHEIDAYLSVYKRLKSLSTRRAVKVTINSSLGNALTRAFCPPWFYAPIRYEHGIMPEDWSWTIASVVMTAFQVGPTKADAGTICSPKTSVILENAKPSSFGRGSETVYDPAYRKGLEIPACDVNFPKNADFELLKDHLSILVSENLFGKRVGWQPEDKSGNKRVRLELYKLVVYEEGGHFDWHMDSTHGDDHHATALLFLGSEWEGGDLKLRHGGCEFSQNDEIRGQKQKDEEHVQNLSEDEKDIYMGELHDAGVHLIAFYTDVEHMVEPVTKGTRIVLQFDVRIGPSDSQTAVDTGEGGSQSLTDYNTDKDDGVNYDDPRYYNRGHVGNASSQHAPSAGVHCDPKILDDVAQMIKQKLSNKTKKNKVEHVAFPLRHLYRLNSIRPEYLKGIDAMLYEHLTNFESQETKNGFKVVLHPVVLFESTDYEGSWTKEYYTPHVWVFESDAMRKKLKRKREEGLVDSEGSNDSDDLDYKAELTEFHLIKGCSLEQIDSREYAEHTGNEAQPGENKYFGGAMFVSLKKEA
ncbi:hypothetical protein VKT23_002894 [Stygiomarasmius scandens]|uniref:Fe2OG dioxygenase domain-containing protein n=1 Tax=Marasmiellus scandens TaxID=2682957 RepID=A0ABR1JZY9_9AGAR